MYLNSLIKYTTSWKMQHPEIAYFVETLYNNWSITKIKRGKFQ
jgi:hypothetical protein